jgi:hypothetical protein
LEHCESEPYPRRQSVRSFSVRHSGTFARRRKRSPHNLRANQPEQNGEAERRSHLDLQVGMLAEQELTVMLQMLQKLCQRAGVDVRSSTQQVQGFSETTDVQKLASELKEKLPEQ